MNTRAFCAFSTRLKKTLCNRFISTPDVLPAADECTVSEPNRSMAKKRYHSCFSLYSFLLNDGYKAAREFCGSSGSVTSTKTSDGVRALQKVRLSALKQTAQLVKVSILRRCVEPRRFLFIILSFLWKCLSSSSISVRIDCLRNSDHYAPGSAQRRSACTKLQETLLTNRCAHHSADTVPSAEAMTSAMHSDDNIG